MMTATHWQLKHHIQFFRTDGEKRRQEARFPVLMYLILSGGQRLRCWPSVETIMRDTGFRKAPVAEALDWLEKRGAIYNVPVDKRVGAEGKLHGNKKVWQLTGVIEVKDKVIEYLNMSDETRQQVIEELAATGLVRFVNLFNKLGSQNEPNSHSDTAVLGSQNELEYAKVSSPNEPKIGSQKSPKSIKEKELNKPKELKNTTKRARKTKREEESELFKGELEKHKWAIMDLIAIDGLDKGFVGLDHMAVPQQKKYLEIAQQLADVGIVFGEIQPLFRCVDDIAVREKWSVKPKSSTLPKYTAQYFQSKAKYAPSNSAEVSPTFDETVEEIKATFSAAESASTVPNNELWLMANDQLKNQLDLNGFERLRNAKLVSWENGAVVLNVATEFDQRECSGRLYRSIRRVLSDVAGKSVDVRFVLAGESPKAKTPDDRLNELGERMKAAKAVRDLEAAL